MYDSRERDEVAVKNKSKALKTVQYCTAKQLDCRMWPHRFLGPALLLHLPCDLKKVISFCVWAFCLLHFVQVLTLY